MINLADVVRSLTGIKKTGNALPVLNTQPGICVFARHEGNNTYLCSNREANAYPTMCVNICLTEGTCLNPQGSYERRK